MRRWPVLLRSLAAEVQNPLLYQNQAEPHKQREEKEILLIPSDAADSCSTEQPPPPPAGGRTPPLMDSGTFVSTDKHNHHLCQPSEARREQSSSRAHQQNLESSPLIQTTTQSCLVAVHQTCPQSRALCVRTCRRCSCSGVVDFSSRLPLCSCTPLQCTLLQRPSLV